MDRAEYLRRYRQEYKDHAKRVTLTFSLSEYRSIARDAKAAGLPIAGYVRRLALQTPNPAKATLPEPLASEFADLDRVIRTIANNVNQMARHSHRIAHVLDEQEVFLHIHALQRELQATIARAATSKPAGSTSASTDDDLRP
jgi:hypothetical protein